jgi:hypothetical protein
MHESLPKRAVIVEGRPPLTYIDCTGEPHDQAGRVVHRCHCCGADLPRDLGDWIVDAGEGGRVALYCSQRCAHDAIEELDQ